MLIDIGCCMPGGSFMPQGEHDIPDDIHNVIIRSSEAVIKTGFDYMEISASFLDGLNVDGINILKKRIADKSLKIKVCNSFIPGILPIFDKTKREDLINYSEKVISRAAALDINIMVFGSGAARNIPEGVSRENGIKQIKEFLKMCNYICEKYNMTVAIEPLNHTECNILNTVSECNDMVCDLSLPHIKLIVDAFHFWMEKEPFSALQKASENIVHVHISEPPDRLYPGHNGGAYLKNFATNLKTIKYNGKVSAECKYIDFFSDIKPAFKFMKENFYES